MIKIGIDGRALQGQRTGIGRYTFELCRRLDVEFSDAEFFVYTNREIEMPCYSSRWKLRYDSSLLGRLKPVIWTKFIAGRLCKNDNLDIFWGTTAFLPKLDKRVKTVVTVYDFNFILVPETMKFTHMLAHKLFYKTDILKSDKRITISNGTAEKIFQYFKINADDVIYPAAENRFKIYSREEIQNVLKQIELLPPYLLAVGTLEPRKNLPVIIDAFIQLKKEGFLKDYKLAIVGGRGWKDSGIINKVESDTSIVRLGFVDDKILPMIYAGAELFVFPSIYEGYGMPVLEAIKCGTKVVASDIPEISEIKGNGLVVYVKPTLNGVKEGIINALKLDVGKGGEVPSHTWVENGQKLAKVFRSLL